MCTDAPNAARESPSRKTGSALVWSPKEDARERAHVFEPVRHEHARHVHERSVLGPS
jgi:hypothetical protein